MWAADLRALWLRCTKDWAAWTLLGPGSAEGTAV